MPGGTQEEMILVHRNQPVADRPEEPAAPLPHDVRLPVPGLPAVDAERAARATLRAQIAKLESELSQLLAERFPFLAAPAGSGAPAAPIGAGAGPSMPGLGELERTRDRLATRLADLRVRAARRSEHERAAHALLERMRLEPGRYRYYRVPVRDLGATGCGVYEVRPRLGLIGMLAGWWQLTLSSGCPLAEGPRRSAAPHPPRSQRSRPRRSAAPNPPRSPETKGRAEAPPFAPPVLRPSPASL